MTNQDISTNDQTDDPSESLEDLDIFCQATAQASLGIIATAWHNLQEEKKLHDYCTNKFASERDSYMLACGLNSLDELPNVDVLERLKLPKFGGQISSETVFNILVQDAYLSLCTLASHRQKADDEIKELKSSQASKLQSAQQSLSWNREQMDKKEKEIGELKRFILIEGGFLFVAFVLGFGGGIWGAIIALIVMLTWRSNIS